MYCLLIYGLVGTGGIGSKGDCLDAGSVGMGEYLVSIRCLFSLLTIFSIILPLVIVASMVLEAVLAGYFWHCVCF